MQEQTPCAIVKYLTDKNIPTPTGKETWRHRTVENILSNEKYKDDARLQKCCTVDFLFRKRSNFHYRDRLFPDYMAEMCTEGILEGVRFVGRRNGTTDENVPINWSYEFSGAVNYLPACVTEAEYLINLANFGLIKELNKIAVPQPWQAVAQRFYSNRI